MGGRHTAVGALAGFQGVLGAEQMKIRTLGSGILNY
jgi:hypothetical protein